MRQIGQGKPRKSAGENHQAAKHTARQEKTAQIGKAQDYEFQEKATQSRRCKRNVLRRLHQINRDGV